MFGAYRDDPSLANEPLDFAGLPGIAADSLRSARPRSPIGPGLAKGADCYVAAAIFAQARAKGPEALEFAKKAREAGLEPVFAGELVQRLARPGNAYSWVSAFFMLSMTLCSFPLTCRKAPRMPPLASATSLATFRRSFRKVASSAGLRFLRSSAGVHAPRRTPVFLRAAVEPV